VKGREWVREGIFQNRFRGGKGPEDTHRFVEKEPSKARVRPDSRDPEKLPKPGRDDFEVGSVFKV
jgi:hypothetical protein